MGYMGLGLQKWIYTMRPRKPFSMQRKGSFTAVPTYSREFKLQYSSESILSLVKQNIGNYRFHDLRHSFGMRLYNQGTPLEQIRKLMGHKKTETTEIYAYASENMMMEIDMPL